MLLLGVCLAINRLSYFKITQQILRIKFLKRRSRFYLLFFFNFYVQCCMTCVDNKSENIFFQEIFTFTFAIFLFITFGIQIFLAIRLYNTTLHNESISDLIFYDSLSLSKRIKKLSIFPRFPSIVIEKRLSIFIFYSHVFSQAVSILNKYGKTRKYSRICIGRKLFEYLYFSLNYCFILKF